jgi:thiol reductant ABC exporter CydC subunit
MKAFLSLLRGVRGRLTAAALAGAGTVAAGAGLLATGAYLIVRADLRPPILELTVAIVGVRFFGISRAALRYLERLSSHDAALHLVARLRTRAYAAIERLAPAGLTEERAGDLLSRVTDDLEELQSALVRAVLPVPVTALAVVAGAAVAAAMLPAAGAVFLAAAAVTAAVAGVATAATARTQGRLLAPLRAELAAAVVDIVEGAREAIAFGQTQSLLASADEADSCLTGVFRRTARVAGLGSGLVTLGSGITIWLVLRLGIDAAASGVMDPVLLGALALLVVAAFEPAFLLASGLTGLEPGIDAARRFHDLESAPAPVAEPAEPLPLPEDPTVRLRSVRLRHFASGPWVLHDVDLDLAPGRRVALVGTSGAGKSTVAQALLRIREIDGGTYCLGGVDARRLRPEDVRRVVGLAGEEAHLLPGTLRSNMVLGRPDASTTEIEAVLAVTRLASWVESLPAGLDTPVSAARVSGGERRRISLARGLLAPFAVLVLDEPTAGLDTATAQAVVNDVLDAAGRRAVLLITHGPEGLERMDEILVLENGRVVERGSHSRLLERGRRYAAFQMARRAGG